MKTNTRHLFKMTLTLVFIILVGCPFACRGAKWTYNGPDGEHHWPRNYPFCGGAFQSPIDFQTQLLRYDPNLPPIQVQNYNLSAHEQLTLSNNGHSVQLSLPPHMYISSLPHRYSAAQLHFHWGSSNLLTGSEHTVNGKQFAAEMHVVHFNSEKYPNISMAVDKHDGLAVLGVFIEIGEYNPAFNKFFKYINGIRYKGQRIQVPSFDIRQLLPAALNEYYRYDGSLTTPPCYPSVLWTVFKKPVTVSHKQFLALATALYATYSQDSAPMPLHGNYRKPQLTDSRVVLVSFNDGLHGIFSVTSPAERRRVVQKLLMGDLADLADDGLHQLLPNLNPQPGANNKWKATKTHGLNNQATQHQQWQKDPKVPSDTVRTSSIGKYLPRHGSRELCFESLEKKVLHQLQRYNAKGQTVEALRDVVFPELNLRSYLDCKSELDLQTVRQLVQGRSKDEATELEQSLTKAMLRQMRRQIWLNGHPNQKSIMGHPQATSVKDFSLGSAYHKPQQVEWED
ncbi:carbonic anhydrase 12 [Triplophysa dalaica]|uniref:carbonic anhydrase 12 n=1 Tax=Triplophysa dalaica TaxID=1582913 RepID=UPI0024DF5F0E|nr:carbonic anhydrase 12 [Triplophysa dalaica]